MSKLLQATCGLILLCAAGFSAAADPPARDNSAGENARIVLATTNLTGSDAELSKFLTDTLITDLSRSTRLAPVERATVEEGYGKLQIHADHSLTAGEVRRLAVALDAERVLVGSFLIKDDSLFLNARVLDARTGLVVPGGAMSVSGNRKDLLPTVHRLARQLHRKLTDADLEIEDTAPVEAPATHQASIPPAPVVDDMAVLKTQGLIPPAAHGNTPLTEPDLAGLIKNVSKYVTPQSDAATTISANGAPVTRIRALAALVKLLVAPDDIANYKNAPPEHLPSDAALCPSWGAAYLSAAVDQGWWPADRAIAGKEPATWAFVATLLTRLPLHGVDAGKSDAVAARTDSANSASEDDPFTGLIVDALDLAVERTMGPRILDESGKVLYPDPSHVPSDDYVQDHGMVSYYTALSDARRAGKHPLVVHATKVSDVGHDDITVTNETAELIREANRRGKFLWKWNVAVLAGKGMPVAKDNTPREELPATMPPH